MLSFPSFLSSFSFTLPSLPSISLPANIQRRFLSFVLKRALGRFVRSEALDAERIQAQISQGWVEIEGLEVNTDEINFLIPPAVPLQLSSGSLSKVTARVPVSNLWSDPLCLTLDSLSLDFTLTRPARKGKDKESRQNTHALDFSHDLAESVTSAADDFLHEELDAYEEAELDQSIRQSLILTQTDPFSNDELPGSFPFGSSGPTSPGSPGQPLPATVESTTVLAGLVERILARLEVKIRNIRIRVHVIDEANPGIFELRVGEVTYTDESSQQESDSLTTPRATTRTIRLSSVAIYMLPPIGLVDRASSRCRPPFGSSSRSSSISSDSSSSSSSGDHEYSSMMMSQGIADLRQSTLSGFGTDASVYHSFVSAQSSVREVEAGDARSEGASTSRSLTPTPAETATESPKETLLVSFGSDDIVLRTQTTQPSQSTPIVATDYHSSQPTHPSPSVAVSHLPAIDVEVTIGTITAVILPKQAAILLAALQSTGNTASDTAQNPLAPASENLTDAKQPRTTIKLQIKAIVISMIYDMVAERDMAFATSLAQCWSKPSATYLPIGHLKLRLETLEGLYTSKEYFGKPPIITRSSTITGSRLPRRSSTGLGIRFGPPPPTLTITMGDASLFEYLASDVAAADDADVPPGGAFPVLIFDALLPKQYDVAPGAASGQRSTAFGSSSSAPVFPEYDTVDWRNSGLQRKTGVSEKQWKVKQKGRGILKGTSATTEGENIPVVMLRKEMTIHSTPSITLQPIHIFLDLSLVERLLPMLRSIAPVIRPPRPDTPVVAAGYDARGQLYRQTSTPQYVIDDLEAQTSSFATVQTSSAINLLEAKCPLVRLDIRCPAPVNRRGTWGDGGHLRSGIVTLDLHRLKASIGGASTENSARGPGIPKGSIRSAEVAKGGTSHVEWDKMILFFCRASERKSSAFIVVGPLAPEPGEVDVVPLLPSVEIKSTVVASTLAKTSRITCRIPSVQAKIRQSTIEGLQFFADDMTHWLDGAFGDGSAPKPRDDLKMIGSRFFGGSARGSSSASSSTDEEDEDAGLSAMILRIVLSEADISLYVPSETEVSERVLSLKASDLDVKVESNATGKQETAFSVIVMDADFSDRTDLTKPARIIGRTTPFTLTTHQQPLIQLRFSSLTNPITDTKETGIKVISSCFTFFVTKDIGWISELAQFAKTPEGVFEDVVPSEITRINLQIFDSSIHLSAPNLPGAIVLVLGSGEVKTDLVSNAGENVIEVGAERIGVLAVDDLTVTTALPVGLTNSADAWKSAGYAQLVDVSIFEAQCLRDMTGTNEVSLDVTQVQVKINACADSLAMFSNLVGDISKLIPQENEVTEIKRFPASLDYSVNVFDSVDEDAFSRIPEIVSASDADMIEDDLPHNLDYLDQATRRSARSDMDFSTGESLRMWQTTSDGEGEVGGETIKILFNEPFEMDKDYWNSLPILGRGQDEEVRLGKTRVRVHNCGVQVLLHDGYDWQKTRKAIEDEIKVVRRRLERIRQLLASGQKADESIERATSSVLFNSIYIGLEQKGDPHEMDPDALLKAIDEELDEIGEETASQSSWQTLPAANDGDRDRDRVPSNRRSGTSTRLKGKRLTRSKKPKMEYKLSGISTEIDLYPHPSSASGGGGREEISEIASRIHITIKEMEILDHIKTSTWKKFLTEMKSDHKGNVRETDADMVRIELVAVRPSLPSLEVENRLRAKILPLRLHVDQDALDFLKRFFSFKAPSAPGPTMTPASPRSNANANPEPFFQHVEIFPIELKLDYKPKRVDFAALREGKTIELMNFFHFDGAEMTLRHITLSGITGWERLSTTLQDLWTPDVKANQLADVISGVSPIRSFVNVGSGVADLILLPIEQYRKDGRLARGVQRGTNSFVKSTALEMMKLGARLATGTQVILEKAEGVLGGAGAGNKSGIGEQTLTVTPQINSLSQQQRRDGEAHEQGSSEDEDDTYYTRGKGELASASRYANQPESMREGVQAAYKSLSKNINAAAQTILAVPMEVYERSGEDGPLRAVVRAVPIAVLKPMIGTTEAVSKTLLGMRNSLDPDARRELGDKYK